MPYESLYVEYEPAARRLALSLVPPHAADDVVAEAFARVLDIAGRNGPPAAFRPYLMAAVRNTARTYHARGRRLVPVSDPQLGPVSGPLRALVEREDARLAGQAFASLPGRWRQVLWATAVEEVTVAALAARLGMTANSVSQLASRAREGLRQAYLTAHLGSDMPPQCRAVAKYMGASVRGRATRRHQAELMAHLSTCTRCAQAHTGLTALNSRLGGLIGPGTAGADVLARMLPPARSAGRGWHLHPVAAATAASAVAATGLTVVPFIAHTGEPVRARAQAAAAPPGHGQPSATASATPVSAARGHPSADAAGVPAPAASAAGSGSAAAGQATPAAAPDVIASATVPRVAAAGQAAPGAGRVVGHVARHARQPVTGTVSMAASAAGSAGQQAGGAVQAAASPAGNLVPQATGTAGGLLGGL